MTVHEHSFDDVLLAPGSDILDLGCAGFEFTDHFKDRYNVYSVDLFDAPYQVAITDYNGRAGVQFFADIQATRIIKGRDDVQCMTLKAFSKFVGVNFWDLIKMDVEGSELEIIMSMDAPMAKQLSVEFHLHTGIYGQEEMKQMEQRLRSLGYTFVQHELTDRHCAGNNYWDSLFILK